MRKGECIYVCDACARKCRVMLKDADNPIACLYDSSLNPEWKKDDKPEFEKDDQWRQPYYDDDEYIEKLTDEQKTEIIKNHFDCKMQAGCPCFLDSEYKCAEWKAYCELTGSDGSDFEFDDCWFRSNEHRCLTDYVLWKMKRDKNERRKIEEKF